MSTLLSARAGWVCEISWHSLQGCRAGRCFPGRQTATRQQWGGVLVRAGGLPMEESGPRRGGGEEGTSETACQGRHLRMRALWAV